MSSKKKDECYTMVFAVEDEDGYMALDYKWVDSIDKAKEIIQEIIDDMEEHNPERMVLKHIVGVFIGHIEPLEIELTKEIKIGGK